MIKNLRDEIVDIGHRFWRDKDEKGRLQKKR